MVVFLLISMALNFLPALARALPAVGPLPVNFAASLDMLLSDVIALNGILPLSEAFTCLGIYLQAWVLLLGWKTLEWIYRLIPLKAT